MKIIHTGDIHLGSLMKNLPPEKAKLRQTELLDTFRRLVAYAASNGVTAVIIAGDLFDGNYVPKTLKQEVFSMIENARSTLFFYVSGNHDDEFDYDDVLPDNLYLFSRNHGWQSYALQENVVVTGMDTKFMTDKNFAALALKKDAFNLVVLHGQIVSNARANEEEIPREELKNRHIDYLALGHIHKPTLAAERLDSRGIYRYCGCLEGRGFDECGQRGFFLLEIKNGKLVNEGFLSMSKRFVQEAEANISLCSNYYDVERVVAEVLKNVPQEYLVKLVLTGRHPIGLKKERALLEARLNERYFFAKVEDRSKPTLNVEGYLRENSMRGEFVREVFACDIDDEMRAEILDVGLKALAGEDIDL